MAGAWHGPVRVDRLGGHLFEELAALGERAVFVRRLDMAVVVAVHFAPYSWLYGTLLYAVVAVVIGLGTAVLLGRQGAVEHADEGAHGRSTGARVCALVGTAMLAGAVVAWFL